MKHIVLFVILLLCLGKANAQSLLNGPEGVVRDADHARWLVACYGGSNIIAMSDGGEQSVFAANVNGALGLHLQGDTLWCTGHDPHMLIGFDIESGERVFEMSMGSMSGAGIASDDHGHLWVASQMGQILDVNRADSTYTNLCTNLTGAQGLVYDAQHDQLLAACYPLNSPIYSIDIETGMIDNWLPTGLGNFIAMTGTPDGRLFFSSWRDNSIRYALPGHDEVETLATGLNQPAGMAVHECGTLMVFAEYGANSLTMVPIPGVAVEHEEAPDVEVGRITATPNPFNPDTTIVFELNQAVHARVNIYDAKGRHTRLLHDGALESGTHRLHWDGHDDNGKPCASGFYIVRVTADGKTRNGKVMLLR